MEFRRILDDATKPHKAVPFADAASLGPGGRCLQPIENVAIPFQVGQQGFNRFVLNGTLLCARCAFRHDIACEQQFGHIDYRQGAAILECQLN